ncbi:hypothetical protein Syn8016DRAFT_1987 [Synechococcus sp. WH 8016]|nr:hypothetical protein Syn8016DRAFT_1987 [Synechococcus sp. WH 8016]
MMALATTSKIQTNKNGLDRATQEILKKQICRNRMASCISFQKGADWILTTLAMGACDLIMLNTNKQATHKDE